MQETGWAWPRCRLDTCRTGLGSVVSLGRGEPVRQARLSDAETVGDILDPDTCLAVRSTRRGGKGGGDCRRFHCCGGR